MDDTIAERNRKATLAVDEGLTSLDADEVLAYFTDEPFWQVNRHRFEGRDGVRQILGYARALYPHGYEREVRSVLAGPEHVVVQHALRAVTNTGFDYDNEYVKVYDFAPDGRIAGVWEHLDSLYSASACSTCRVGRPPRSRSPSTRC